jgi:tetratricopeptide (TPR) repeat protein
MATLGRYRIERQLSPGVYAAYDPELDRRVALKRLDAGAAAQAGLTHPNVVTIHEIASDGEQRFMVMELVEGATLREWLAAGRGWREVLGAFLAAGDGLEAAHRAGIAHGDFSTDHVVLARDGRARVGDFGFQKDAAADVARFSAVLSEALPSPPRWLKRALSRPHPSMTELLQALRADPTPRRKRALALATGVCVVAALIAWERVATRSTLCSGAAQALAGVWDAARKQSVHGAFLATGATSAGIAWGLVEKQLDGYARDWTAMHTGACEATRLQKRQSEEVLDLRMQCLSDRLGELRALADVLATADAKLVARVAAGMPGLSSLSGCANVESLRARERPPAEPELRAQVASLKDKLARAQALFNADRLAPALAGAEEVLAAPAARQYAPLRASALHIRGVSLEYLHRLDEAVAALQESATVALQARLDDVAALSWIHVGLIVGYRHNDLAGGLKWLGMAEALSARVGSDELELKRLHALADLYHHHEHYDEGEAAARRGLAIAERLHNDDALAIGYSQISDGLAARGRSDEALALLERARQIHERKGDSYNLSLVFDQTSLVLYDLHRFSESADAAGKAVAIREKLLAEHDPLLAAALLNWADPLVRAGRLDEAETVLARMERIDQGIPRIEIVDSVTQLPWLRGEIALKRGHAAEAVPLLERALADKQLRAGTPRGTAELSLARALWQTGGSKRRAQSLAEEARAELGRESPPDPLLVAEAQAWLAQHR